jgi:hypothetical protein
MAHLAAVQHYTQMARQAAAMTSAQIAYDNRAEPEPLEFGFNADDAQAQAEDEILTTTEPLADWIAKKCDCDQGRAPIDTTKLEDVDLIDCDRVPVLLACIVAGDYQQMNAASRRLRALFLATERKTVGQRAAQLLAGAL